MNYLGRTLIIMGVLLVVAGVFFTLAPLDSKHLTGLGGKIPWLGRLPGDIIIQKKNFSFYFPVTTCILISIILSAIFFLFFKR
ncbi:MAG: DUF2905 domain-containing protein [Candidatus Omnitrophica bacterium]|nr:DUF2905 domain-containing protein [Candidatus Omnitrophota bacterium]